MCFPVITFSLISLLSLVSLFSDNHAQHIYHARNHLRVLTAQPRHSYHGHGGNQLPYHLRVLTAQPRHSYHGHGVIHSHHSDHLLHDHLGHHEVINPLRSDHRYHGDHPYLNHHSDQVLMVNPVVDHQPLESSHQLQFHSDLRHFKTSHSNPIEDFMNFGEISRHFSKLNLHSEPESSRHFSKLNLHSEPESSGEIYHHDYHKALPSVRHEVRLTPLSDDHDYRIRKPDYRTIDHHGDLISRHDLVDFHHRGGKLISDPLLIEPISEESKLSLSLKDDPLMKLKDVPLMNLKDDPLMNLKDVNSENDPLMKLKQDSLINELDSHAKAESRNIIPLPRGNEEMFP